MDNLDTSDDEEEENSNSEEEEEEDDDDEEEDEDDEDDEDDEEAEENEDDENSEDDDDDDEEDSEDEDDDEDSDEEDTESDSEIEEEEIKPKKKVKGQVPLPQKKSEINQKGKGKGKVNVVVPQQKQQQITKIQQQQQVQQQIQRNPQQKQTPNQFQHNSINTGSNVKKTWENTQQFNPRPNLGFGGGVFTPQQQKQQQQIYQYQRQQQYEQEQQQQQSILYNFDDLPKIVEQTTQQQDNIIQQQQYQFIKQLEEADTSQISLKNKPQQQQGNKDKQQFDYTQEIHVRSMDYSRVPEQIRPLLKNKREYIQKLRTGVSENKKQINGDIELLRQSFDQIIKLTQQKLYRRLDRYIQSYEIYFDEFEEYIAESIDDDQLMYQQLPYAIANQLHDIVENPPKYNNNTQNTINIQSVKKQMVEDIVNRCVDDKLMEFLEHDDPENWFRSYLSRDISYNNKTCVLSEALSIEPTQESLVPLNLQDEVISMAFINENLVALSLGDFSVRIFDANEQVLGQNCEGHQSIVTALATIRVYTPDNTDEEDFDLATGDQNGSIIIWSLSQRNQNKVCQGHMDTIVSIVDLRDGNTIASGSKDGAVFLWDIQDSEIIDEQKLTAPVTDLILTKNKNFLAVSDSSQTLSIYSILYSKKLETNLVEGLKIHKVYKLQSACTCLNTDFTIGNYIFSGHTDGTINLWNISNNTQSTPVSTLNGFNGSLADFALVEDVSNLNSGTPNKFLLFALTLNSNVLDVRVVDDGHEINKLSLTSDAIVITNTHGKNKIQIYEGEDSENRIIVANMSKNPKLSVWKI